LKRKAAAENAAKVKAAAAANSQRAAAAAADRRRKFHALKHRMFKGLSFPRAPALAAASLMRMLHLRALLLPALQRMVQRVPSAAAQADNGDGIEHAFSSPPPHDMVEEDDDTYGDGAGGSGDFDDDAFASAGRGAASGRAR
jgi:hypothetical protein